jgi:SAM-dependent methyltransferase
MTPTATKKARFRTVSLSAVEDLIVLEIRELYRKVEPEKKTLGVYSRFDWARIDYVFRQLKPGGRILDVGVGSGQLYNSLKRSRRFSEVIGIDIRRHSRYLEVESTDGLREMSVTKIAFPDRYFDTVICMEVLEHLKPRDFPTAVAELRRVCNGTLIMTVPFEEPEPLPSFHKSRFNGDDLERIFPRGNVTLLEPNRGVPWALIREEYSGTENEVDPIVKTTD